MALWGRRSKGGPTGITISTRLGEWFDKRGNCTFGFELRRVWFGDHRHGWSGINLYLYFWKWEHRFCIVRWQNPPYPVKTEPTYTLRQQIADTHGDRWAAYETKMEANEEEEREYLKMQQRIVNEGIRRRNAADAQYPPAGDDEN